MRRKPKGNFCELKRHRIITPSICSVCERIGFCKSFREYYMKNKRKYQAFVYEQIERFPDKYIMEVVFMATKATFIQIVDKKTGQIEKIINMETLEAMPLEEKIKFARGKVLYQIAYEIEPIIKIEMKKKMVEEEISYLPETDEIVKPEPKVEPEKLKKTTRAKK
jgi:hypothetical protein